MSDRRAQLSPGMPLSQEGTTGHNSTSRRCSACEAKLQTERERERGTCGPCHRAEAARWAAEWDERHDREEEAKDTALAPKPKARRIALDTPMADVRMEVHEFLWDNRIPLGSLTVLAGRGGTFKSTFTTHLAAEASLGRLPGDRHGDPVSTLLIGHEDSPEHVVTPRFVAAGADISRVTFVTVGIQVGDTITPTMPNLPEDIELIRAKIEQYGAELVIIDPITSLIRGNLYNAGDVREVLNALLGLAIDTGVAVVLVMHVNKGGGNRSDKLSGSHAFRDVPRAVWLFAKDDDGQVVMTCDKSSYSDEEGRSYAFESALRDVKMPNGTVKPVPTIQWLGPTDKTFENIINREPGGAEDLSDTDEAIRWLRDYLDKAGGEAAKKVIAKAAAADGIREKPLRTARERLNLTTRSAGFPAVSYWSLPSSHAQLRPAVPSSEGGHDWARQGTAELCPVCGEPTGHRFPGYCDTLDNAHALHRADAEEVRT